MAGTNKKKRLNKSSGGPDPNEPVELAPALSELLDHLASQLRRRHGSTFDSWRRLRRKSEPDRTTFKHRRVNHAFCSLRSLQF